MAPKIIKGFDEEGREVFSRNAREYDQASIEKKIFGISGGDILKALAFVFAAGVMFAHFQNTEKNQSDFNMHMTEWIKNDSEKSAIEFGKVSSTLQHLDISLTQITGRAFNDGLPMPAAQVSTTTTVQ